MSFDTLLYPLNFSKLEARNMVIHVLASAPSSPVEGQVYFNSTDDTLRVYDGGAWKILGRLDQISAPTAAVALNGQKITGLADGTAATDAATKGQVDAASAGLDAKPSVRAATTANITLSAAQTIDGVAVIAGNRVLVKNQTAGADNGIYVAAAGAWARAADADTSAEINAGMYAFVEEGTANGNSGWVLTTDDPITLGTTALAFSKFTASASTLAKFSADVGDGAATSIAVTHSLGTRDVSVSVRRVASPYEAVGVRVEMTDANTVTLVFAVAPTAAQYRVSVIG